uniref:EOG090X0AW0 n=1 Tax=Lynceus sp. MCZ IZ 141354 TaxID=1930659 RepID=A0A9N6WW12_9CRUS|nr:EOG090X0AW0 [Lynceus sp. MCZ IZ 141354]
MATRVFSFFPRSSASLRTLFTSTSCRSSPYDYGIDPGPLFFNPKIHNLLQRLLGCDYNKIFAAQKLGVRLDVPKYKFMTNEELEEAMKEAEKKASVRLQMPPLLKEREPINGTLSSNPEIKYHDDFKYVFTDITLGHSDRSRAIVVRDPDGTLRQASWDERARMNQIFFPNKFRSLKVPPMFADENLKSLLEREEYLFILDKACIQFEPDDPEYIRATRKTYNHINEHGHYDVLYSTRHYGPMTLHLVLEKRIDDLLLHLIKQLKLESAADLVRIYNITHKTEKDADNFTLIKEFIATDSLKKGILELALDTYQEIQQQSQEMQSLRQASS